MSDQIKFLVERHQPLTGLAAWSARLPDQSLTSFSPGEWLPSSRVEQALTRLTLAADGLVENGIQPVRLCWTFEQMRIFVALRPDRSSLALFFENRPDLPDERIRALFDQFAAGAENTARVA